MATLRRPLPLALLGRVRLLVPSLAQILKGRISARQLSAESGMPGHEPKWRPPPESPPASVAIPTHQLTRLRGHHEDTCQIIGVGSGDRPRDLLRPDDPSLLKVPDLHALVHAIGEGLRAKVQEAARCQSFQVTSQRKEQLVLARIKQTKREIVVGRPQLGNAPCVGQRDVDDGWLSIP